MSGSACATPDPLGAIETPRGDAGRRGAGRERRPWRRDSFLPWPGRRCGDDSQVASPLQATTCQRLVNLLNTGCRLVVFSYSARHLGVRRLQLTLMELFMFAVTALLLGRLSAPEGC